MADITVMNKQEQEINTGATQENTATQPLPVEPVTPVPSYVEGLTEDEADQEAVRHGYSRPYSRKTGLLPF
mgnify:CR=1 FL=1